MEVYLEMEEVNRLIIFDILGPMAHFRKFYTNSSSLTYSFPPRTTIMGLIAGILGFERDTYYGVLDNIKCKVAICVKSKIRKIMQTVNLINTDNFSSYSQAIKNIIIRNNPHPTPFEFIRPISPQKQIIYRIYFTHSDRNLMQDLNFRLKNKNYVYPPYLGLTEFIADTHFIAEVNKEHIIEKTPIMKINIDTVCNVEYIENSSLEFKIVNENILQYIKEKMPFEFGFGREIKRTASYIYEKNQEKIKAKLSIPYYELVYFENDQEKRENIIFM